MALLAKGIWVVVADGERALLLENDGTPQKPRLVLRQKLESDGPGMDLADKPGRMQDTGRQQLSAMEPTDHDRIAADRFGADVAERIGALVEKGKISKVVVVAPPHTLGAMRDAYDGKTRAAILAEIDKDLTNHPLDKIGDLVAQDIDRV